MLNSKEQHCINGISISDSKAKALLRWLILEEKKNAKSKEKSYGQMVSIIQANIERVVGCY
jgi:hypothetical protein